MSRALTLADFAAVERDGRAQFYPAMVRDREISAEDAQQDWLCWKAIAAWVDAPHVHPEFFNWDLHWDDLVAAARRALARRETALASATDLNRPGLEERRNAVGAILGQLDRTATFYRQLNEELRRDAEARRQIREAA